MYTTQLVLMLTLGLAVQTQARAVRDTFKPNAVRRQAAPPTITQAVPDTCRSVCDPYESAAQVCLRYPSVAEQEACVCQQSFIDQLTDCFSCPFEQGLGPSGLTALGVANYIQSVKDYCAANVVTSAASTNSYSAAVETTPIFSVTRITSASLVTEPTTGSTGTSVRGDPGTVGTGRATTTTTQRAATTTAVGRTGATTSAGGGGTTSGNNAATGAGQRSSMVSWAIAVVAGAVVGGAMLVCV